MALFVSSEPNCLFPGVGFFIRFLNSCFGAVLSFSWSEEGFISLAKVLLGVNIVNVSSLETRILSFDDFLDRSSSPSAVLAGFAACYGRR